METREEIVTGYVACDHLSRKNPNITYPFVKQPISVFKIYSQPDILDKSGKKLRKFYKVTTKNTNVINLNRNEYEVCATDILRSTRVSIKDLVEAQSSIIFDKAYEQTRADPEFSLPSYIRNAEKDTRIEVFNDKSCFECVGDYAVILSNNVGFLTDGKTNLSSFGNDNTVITTTLDQSQITSSGNNNILASLNQEARITSSGCNALILAVNDNCRVLSCGANSTIVSTDDYNKLVSNGTKDQVIVTGNNSQVTSNGSQSTITLFGNKNTITVIGEKSYTTSICKVFGSDCTINVINSIRFKGVEGTKINYNIGHGKIITAVVGDGKLEPNTTYKVVRNEIDRCYDED